MAAPKINDINGLTIGIDIGSTTAKAVLIEDGEILFSCYERHFSQVRSKTLEIVKRLRDLIKDREFTVAISGSAGLGLAEAAKIPFVQEVYATSETVRELAPDTSVVIELGGEDAKVIFFKGGMDQRMNGTCAGGTGAFIDQMATLLNVTNEEMDKLSLQHERIYPIASRCGVFAKTDIQPLLNQGAQKSDVAASIYQAVVNQTIAGLAQGRKIEGKVMFLGGPLYYCKGLRERFVETLKLNDESAIFPEYGRLSVSIGAAIYAAKQNDTFTFDDLVSALESVQSGEKVETGIEPLFRNQQEYDEFCARHDLAKVDYADITKYRGKSYLGIDCGSTTTKVALITDDCRILYTYYSSNKGNPVEIVREQLTRIREIIELNENKIVIAGSAVTGYGEELIQHAFHIDSGVVETIAHFNAARHFNPNVDFIIDIGGQDIKCFKVHNNSIDSIMLNEACSSGCGSFIETFAKSMGYGVEEFSRLGLFAKMPVNLGTRCTVFMNSSVKQAQKDGADVSDISAGLSMSVVKNAIYKVIRASSADELGQHIVVQGGTFYNDAVLRSFEREIGRNVVRPQISGLMGAFGAALFVKKLNPDKSETMSLDELKSFTHSAKSATCNGCGNHCRLTVNIFGDGGRFISGNQCEKGAGAKSSVEDLPDLYEFKRSMFDKIATHGGNRGTIGLPLALGMYELAPFWNGIFACLGFNVVLSGFGSREMYTKGQYSIPSDTACYPAKIMHGHIETLIEKGVDAIFYPCLSYNFDENQSDNHYNCPVVAYYSELLKSNMDSLNGVKFLYPYLNINNSNQLAKELQKCLCAEFGGITLSECKAAVKAGLSAYKAHMNSIYSEGERAVSFARSNGKRIMILAGRPYHIDPEICHGIDKLAKSLGFVVVSEDSLGRLCHAPRVNVLNQWTYHSRLYAAADYACKHDDVEFVQLVSFGCGLDAITTDEVRSILENGNKLYTQIKIDEITNLGAVKIRLRSLLGALDERRAKQ